MNEINNLIILILQETIRHKNNKYCLVAGSGKNLGCYRSKSGAENREKQVNYFKWKKKKLKKEMSSMGSGAVSISSADSERKDNG